MGRAFKDKLASSFKTFRQEDARLVGEVKVLLDSHHQLLLRDLEADGLEIARKLSGTVDLLLSAYLEHAEEGGGLSLLALGGYGRGELSPRSDIDLLVLYPEKGEERAGEFTGPLLAFLWDLGFEVGHATRSPSGSAEAMAGGDLPSATAMLEARLVAGSPVLHKSYVERVTESWLDEHRGDFISRKIEEARKRHRFYGGSSSICNPNVKESPGGLRDMHVAGWISLALSGRRDFRAFREAGILGPERTRDLLHAYGRLHQVRHAMHLVAGERQDVLHGDLRHGVADALGYYDDGGLSAAEHLMRSYYRSARRLSRFLERVIRFQEGCGLDSERRRIEPGLLELGDELCPSGAAEWTPLQALDAVRVAVEAGLRPAPELVDAVEAAGARIDGAFRSDAAAADLFRAILSAPAAGPGLRALDRAGFLRKYIPEYGAVTGLIRDELVHRYTVDEHTLRALDSLDWLMTAEHPVRPQADLVARKDLLRLAILLHDVGKVQGPNHVAHGVGMVPDVARRLGLDEGEARFVRFLVEHHPLIPKLADRRSPAEAARVLADRMPGEEYLRCLYLHTLADVEAVGGGALTGWREAQFAKLFDSALGMLSPSEPVPFEERVLDLLAEARHEEARAHLHAMDARYTLEVEPALVVHHLDLLATRGESGVALGPRAVHSDRGYAEVWAAAPDEPGVFSKIAGVLALHGLDITSAQACTRRDGVAVDGFTVTREDDAPPESPDFWREVEEDLRRVVEGSTDLEERLAGIRRRYRVAAESPPPGVVPGARVSNDISESHSLITVTAPDRPGLLHDLADAISRHGLSIHHAIVATRGGVVLDTFYLALPGGGRPTEDALEPLRRDLDSLAGDPSTAEA